MESSLEFSNSFTSVSSPSARCRIFKIIVIGDSGVGKTCLTYRFCAGEFLDRTEATIGVDFRERLVEVEGEKIKLQLWDTAGQERFRKSMVQQYYRNVHAVLFIYDVTRPDSFRGLPAWIEECRRYSLGQEITRFLVGNKSDLRDTCSCDPGSIKVEGQVTRDQAQKFAVAHGMILFETSAKSLPGGGGGGGEPGGGHQDSVEDVFMALASRLKRQTRPPPPVLNNTGVSGSYCGSYTGTSSFRLPAKKNPQKDFWTCTC
ncbi:ras-related protein Rab-33B-like isoform X1 [Oncorhynchus kisutch]|uniref:RAB33B, member RAS onco family n=1 Tax=Oncorhynchus kisutch TaxID=8019 RepID=A0A8C7J861_ONCKI|nr:ras-related protein Rab-33B isoform X1 [Oncorhynchus kisutch]XP_031670860.1 ras-related protein Rab-33B-like isoform X1 [Oncorhynchus kisutch]